MQNDSDRQMPHSSKMFRQIKHYRSKKTSSKGPPKNSAHSTFTVSFWNSPFFIKWFRTHFLQRKPPGMVLTTCILNVARKGNIREAEN
ncbi:unnamed protein product [Acanthoscelides obtectus]|uniref:Uncharacterized protein n=1 Tax=Acanthoscelides obtectus TaxID=200917 RepID=A0A9P0PWI2_ACAOB|nr:unnamed protein product [Acanthoscelides obtectus]CAK1673371.1 hypothetical protein AOBTE_LOCUS29312 [Acanthoscelides obtectus]